MTNHWRAVWLLITAVALCTGCYEVVVNDSADYWRSMGSSRWQQGKDGKAAVDKSLDRQWTILLKQFHGHDAKQQALRLKHRLDREQNMIDLYVEEMDDDAYLYRGMYLSPIGDRLADNLRQTRMITLDGKQLFADANVVRVGTKIDQPTDPYDLRQFTGYLSLQVAAYTGPERERQKIAEKAVKILRDDGDEAFFYHGQTMSMVTVGLFSQDKDVIVKRTLLADGSVVVNNVYSERVRQLQKKYPDNLVNGKKIMATDMQGKKISQESFLVPAP